jgi:hypothetical protein
MTFTKSAFGITTSQDCQDGIAMLGAAGGDFRINMQQCSYPITRTRKVGVDDTITEEVFKSHLQQAGQLIGIGRWRPRNNGMYGRFVVNSMTWEEYTP